jgi:hypothetical protein
MAATALILDVKTLLTSNSRLCGSKFVITTLQIVQAFVLKV